jgi:voltage-gated potassium channel
MAIRREGSVSYQLFMLVLCVYTLLMLGVEVALRPGGEVQALLEYADLAVCAFFLVDFVLCLYNAPNRWKYFYTWGWLDLLSSIPALDAARWGRAARVARILRLLRGLRATKILGSLVLAKREQSTFLAGSLSALLLLVAASISILRVETADDSNIRTAGDALWWSLSTITTVGYGDRFPVTTEGRLVAAVLMCAGVALFGMLSGLLAAWFTAPKKAHEHNEVAALREEVRLLREVLERWSAKGGDDDRAPLEGLDHRR